MRSARDAVRLAAHAGFERCRLRSGYPNTDCERSKAASWGRFAWTSRDVTFAFSVSTSGSPRGAARIGNWRAASVSWTAAAHGRAIAPDRVSNRRIVKPTGWVVDIRHYLDEATGDLPEIIPERVLRLAVFFGSVVAWVTDHLPQRDLLTNVPCRRSPGRRRCRGEIVAELDRASGRIVWHCPLCGDNGLIHGWEDTPWDRQHDAGAAPTSPSPATKH